jgi:Glycosyltransferases, probably involved in cell wall biogenesis
MDWYFLIVAVAIVFQVVFLFHTYRNFLNALAKHKKKRLWHELQVALIVPCKGLDLNFEKNIASFFKQDYENYRLCFVVADQSDPAYNELCKLKNQLSPTCKAQDVQIFIAGQAKSCGQKTHNLFYCYQQIGNDVDILAFADSDIIVRNDWLSHLVWPLRRSKTGVATGYRWFVPKKNNVASLALSAINAKIAQQFGNTHFNQAWGGSMAIRVETFRQIGLDKIWPKSLSDDGPIGSAVRKAGMKAVFVPACLVASYTSVSWRELFEFGRRQFLITRIYAPQAWWFGVLGSLYAVLCIWATAVVAVYAATFEDKNILLFAAIPVFFLTNQLLQAIMRQAMISKLLEKDWPQMKAACAADILGFWLWSPLMLLLIISSAFGRTLCWRGIRYKLPSPTEIIILDGNQ